MAVKGKTPPVVFRPEQLQRSLLTMTKTIAFAGKGGVGKTTICGMLVQYLCRRKDGAVLAVDADADADTVAERVWAAVSHLFS